MKLSLFETIDIQGNKSYFNTQYLMYMEPNSKGGCSITVQGAMAKTFYDFRPIDTIRALLSK